MLSIALDPDAASVRLNYSLADRKPQTLTCIVPFEAAVAYPRKLLEQVDQFIGRYSSAFVVNAEREAILNGPTGIVTNDHGDSNYLECSDPPNLGFQRRFRHWCLLLCQLRTSR